MSASESRHELAQFLRTRRERISPDQVGLPAGKRRRTRGLRREEVAVLAGLSPTWYTYLEQARDIRPSPEVLDSLATVLLLTPDERKYLHQLALGSPPSDAPGMGYPLVDKLVEVAGAGPYPVYALDHVGEVIAWNAAAAEWYTDWSTKDEMERNIVWWLVTSPEARERIVGWAEDARDIVGRLRAGAARYPEDPRILDLINRLHDSSPEFRGWWAKHDVRGQRLRVRTFRHPQHGVVPMRLAVVHPHDDSYITIAFHLPHSTDAEY